MPRPATGELRPLSDGWEARIRIDAKKRRGFRLVPFPVADRAGAEERCKALAAMAARLRCAPDVDEKERMRMLEMGARARCGRPWEAIVAAVDALCGGRTISVTSPTDGTPMTMKKLGETWRSGELHRKHRDHVRKKKPTSILKDDVIAREYVDPHIGDLAPADVTLLDCEQVMANIPEGLSASWRRSVAVYMNTLLGYAVYPLRLRSSHPIPKRWIPRGGSPKAMECIYPSEDAKLMACTDVPLLRRLFYGMDEREGPRTDELGSLQWRDLDLVHGRIALDENKTDEPRDWDLDPGVWRALKRYKECFAPDATPDDFVYAELGVRLNVNRLPYFLRRDLKKSGVTREKLFEKSAVRSPIRAHDLRATFVTVSIAAGKSEGWVTRRTGHRSHAMVAKYTRKASTWNLGPFGDLDALIPELRYNEASTTNDLTAPEQGPALPHERPSDLPEKPQDARTDIAIPQELRAIVKNNVSHAPLQVDVNTVPH